jgi:hypothetical protein
MKRSRSAVYRATKPTLEDEIAHLRDLDLKGLRLRWQVHTAITRPSTPKQLIVRAVLWQTSLSLMAITVRSQRMDKRCPRILGCCSVAPWIAHITAILNLYVMPFGEGRRRFLTFSIRFSAATRRLS